MHTHKHPPPHPVMSTQCTMSSLPPPTHTSLPCALRCMKPILISNYNTHKHMHTPPPSLSLSLSHTQLYYSPYIRQLRDINWQRQVSQSEHIKLSLSVYCTLTHWPPTWGHCRWRSYQCEQTGACGTATGRNHRVVKPYTSHSISFMETVKGHFCSSAPSISRSTNLNKWLKLWLENSKERENMKKELLENTEFDFLLQKKRTPLPSPPKFIQLDNGKNLVWLIVFSVSNISNNIEAFE